MLLEHNQVKSKKAKGNKHVGCVDTHHSNYMN